MLSSCGLPWLHQSLNQKSKQSSVTYKFLHKHYILHKHHTIIKQMFYHKVLYSFIIQSIFLVVFFTYLSLIDRRHYADLCRNLDPGKFLHCLQTMHFTKLYISTMRPFQWPATLYRHVIRTLRLLARGKYTIEKPLFYITLRYSHSLLWWSHQRSSSDRKYPSDLILKTWIMCCIIK